MLLGREAEQRVVDEMLQKARGGRSAVLVLRGEPGIGKTALLGYAERGAGDMTVLRCAGSKPSTSSRSPGCTSCCGLAWD
jgi:DNA helicase TIP49 (TBP-interacting protein)